jgi:AraC-like DNA-binding protein
MFTVYREERFRTPLEAERSLGLWIDRIGFDRNFGVPLRPDKYRVLGQFAAVAVEKGKGKIAALGAQPVAVERGDAFLIFPSETAQYGPDRAWSTCWVVWNGPEAAVLHQLGYLAEDNSVIRGGASAVRLAWDRLKPLMSREDREALLARKTILLEMIGELNTLQRLITILPAQAAVEGAVLELTLATPTPISVVDLARRSKLSPAYFRRLFKEHTGTSPKTFQLAQRINRAKEMLSAGRSTKDISETLGFTDVFHFMRVFKNLTGQTVGQYSRPRH